MLPSRLSPSLLQQSASIKHLPRKTHTQQGGANHQAAGQRGVDSTPPPRTTDLLQCCYTEAAKTARTHWNLSCLRPVMCSFTHAVPALSPYVLHSAVEAAVRAHAPAAAAGPTCGSDTLAWLVRLENAQAGGSCSSHKVRHRHILLCADTCPADTRVQSQSVRMRLPSARFVPTTRPINLTALADQHTPAHAWALCWHSRAACTAAANNTHCCSSHNHTCCNRVRNHQPQRNASCCCCHCCPLASAASAAASFAQDVVLEVLLAPKQLDAALTSQLLQGGITDRKPLVAGILQMPHRHQHSTGQDTSATALLTLQTIPLPSCHHRHAHMLCEKQVRRPRPPSGRHLQPRPAPCWIPCPRLPAHLSSAPPP